MMAGTDPSPRETDLVSGLRELLTGTVDRPIGSEEWAAQVLPAIEQAIEALAADDEACIACLVAFKPGDEWLPEASGGAIHFACCGPERESFTGADGEPLAPGEPIPTPLIWNDHP